MTIRVLIVDDDPLLRAGLKLMLGGAEDIRVVGEAGDGSGVQSLIDRLAPDVILMDIRMPGIDGLTATEAVRRRPGAPEVVILTTFDADEHALTHLRRLRRRPARPPCRPRRLRSEGPPARRDRRVGTADRCRTARSLTSGDE